MREAFGGKTLLDKNVKQNKCKPFQFDLPT